MKKSRFFSIKTIPFIITLIILCLFIGYAIIWGFGSTPEQSQNYIYFSKLEPINNTTYKSYVESTIKNIHINNTQLFLTIYDETNSFKKYYYMNLSDEKISTEVVGYNHKNVTLEYIDIDTDNLVSIGDYILIHNTFKSYIFEITLCYNNTLTQIGYAKLQII